MARIFISYKRADKDKVFKIKNQIEADIHEECWMDLKDISSDASSFENEIMHAINQAEIVLFMYSHQHTLIKDIEKDWTARELNYANNENKKIVFVNIDQSPLVGWFSFNFGLKQQVDITSPDAIFRLTSDLKIWLQSPNSSSASQPAADTRTLEQVISDAYDMRDIATLTRYAELGHSYAETYLGNCYLEGHGVPQSYAKAIEWYRKAAAQREPVAQYTLAYCYENGFGVPQSYDQAVDWMSRAAENGYDPAQCSLGYYYLWGQGVSQSREKAAEWFRKAAQQGNETAEEALENMRNNRW